MSVEAMKQALEALSYVMSHGVAVQQAKDILLEAIEQAEKQEPVAWHHTKKGRTEFTTNPTPDLIGTYWKPLYPRPPSKVWIGITDLEFKYIVCKNHNPHTQSAKRIRQTIKEIEDLLKERNT
jgi:hypothetical protein